MKTPNLFKLLFTASALLLLFAACAKKENNSQPENKTSVSDLKEESLLSDGGCLSAEKLQKEFYALNASLRATVLPTKLSFESKRMIRPNFEMLVALNQLSIQEKPLSEIADLESAIQSGCDSVTVNRAGGLKDFSIKESSRNHVRFRSKDGEEIEYLLINSRSLQLTKKYIGYDVPCRSEKTPIFIKISRLIDWSGNSLTDLVETTSRYNIERPFLELVGQAVGYSVADLYQNPDDGSATQLLSMNKVRDMTQLPARPELISCGESDVAPTDPDEPDSENGDGSDGESSEPGIN